MIGMPRVRRGSARSSEMDLRMSQRWRGTPVGLALGKKKPKPIGKKKDALVPWQGPTPSIMQLHHRRQSFCEHSQRIQSRSRSVQTGFEISRPSHPKRMSTVDTMLGNKEQALTSGGMAIDHMATPAVPPARMTALRFKSEGEEPAGVRSFLVTS